MATKTKAAPSPPTDVTIPRSVLRQFISLVDGLDQADRAYKTCQDSLFRDYARGACHALNVQTAVTQAKAALEAAEPAETA